MKNVHDNMLKDNSGLKWAVVGYNRDNFSEEKNILEPTGAKSV